MPVECTPQAECALFEICKQIAQGKKEHIRKEFDAIVDNPGNASLILGNQDYPNCIPFNHKKRNEVLGDGELNVMIYNTLLLFTLKNDERVRQSAKGWHDIYKPTNN